MGMRIKTINSVITKNITKWTSSIKDPEVRTLAARNIIVTGGSITSMLLGEEIKDFDVYFTNKETAVAVANYYVDEFNKSHCEPGDITPVVQVQDDIRHEDCIEPGRVEIFIQSEGVAAEDGFLPEDSDAEEIANAMEEGVEQDDGEKYRPVYLSSNAITLSNKIQLILRFYGNPEEIHENYDFVHCTNYWTPRTGTVTNTKALEAILAKELRYVGSKYPLCSIIRTRKFINRGWKINAGQYLKMCMQLQQFDLTDVNVLKDQLTGVDVAYFNMLIDEAQECGADIDAEYICTLVDRLF